MIFEVKYSARFVFITRQLVLLVLFCPSVAAAQIDFRTVAGILEEQCLDCHNSDKREGTVDLSRFRMPADIDQDRELWKTIFDVVDAGQMPLPQSGYELSDSQRTDLLEFTRSVLRRPDRGLQAVDPGKPILRRLTRLEYNNTVRDLFEIDYDVFMFPERLPFATKRYFTQMLPALQKSQIPIEKSKSGNVARSFESASSTAHQERGQAFASDALSLGLVIQTSMREYGQKYDVLLPQLGLPGDSRAEHGFANRGDTLNFSPLLFEKYLELASAIAFSERLWRDSRVMQSLLGMVPPLAKSAARDSQATPMSGDYAVAERIGGEAARNDRSYHGFAAKLKAAYLQGYGGTCEISSALNNQKVAGKGGLLKLGLQGNILTINPNVDLWLATFATADETSGEHLLTNHVKGEKTFELTFAGQDAFRPEIQELGVCVLARRKQSGRVRLTVGLSNGSKLSREAAISEATGNTFFSWAVPAGASIVKLTVDGSGYSGDYILLDDLGFIFGPQSTMASGDIVDRHDVDRPEIGTSDADVSRFTLRVRVERFLQRAYRRPATAAELDDAMNILAQRTNANDSELLALRRLVQRVLASPEFLFLAEPVTPAEPAVSSVVADVAGKVRPLTPFELASRLSYFLWSSMPDDELLAAAELGMLKEPEELRRQVRRMLAVRSRSRELSESFAAQWLRLDQLYSARPDQRIHKRFYSGPQDKATLHGPMMTEPLLLFETVLLENRSLLELFDSKYSWLNSQLADLYGLQESFKDALQHAVRESLITQTEAEKLSHKYWLRTHLSDRNRGGLMTMAGPLLLTSLPYRTSPIKRGAWLLETVFNRPPSEPKVAFVLDEGKIEDGNTASDSTLSVRQRFERHRSDPNCYACHSRIDPPGFSLEVFDAIGAIRTHDGTQSVDATGEWNGMEFDGPAEFKAAVMARERELARGFTEHLLSYALGRKLRHYDMQTVDNIVLDAEESGYRIGKVIESIVLSYPFRNIRNVR
ncbi:DUF1592 domain-containing protein [Planctomycetaceae bacterium SH139]